MHNSRYSFRRKDGLNSFFSSNRASTDAINALQIWTGKDRSYDVLEDKDELLVAALKFKENDKTAELPRLTAFTNK